jgi:hypothetical protein
MLLTRSMMAHWASATVPPRRCSHLLDLEALLDRIATHALTNMEWDPPHLVETALMRVRPSSVSPTPARLSQSQTEAWALSGWDCHVSSALRPRGLSPPRRLVRVPGSERIAARFRTWGSPRCQPHERARCRNTASVHGVLPATHTPFEGLFFSDSCARVTTNTLPSCRSSNHISKLMPSFTPQHSRSCLGLPSRAPRFIRSSGLVCKTRLGRRALGTGRLQGLSPSENPEVTSTVAGELLSCSFLGLYSPPRRFHRSCWIPTLSCEPDPASLLSPESHTNVTRR